ncbi:MAG: 1-acylglycerol-3-phosphate O-acyltransferase [Bacteriovoracaceae bacterium]|nr:1-acylglycerol-3-phosphate O-acyltransferase [Bacteriovoracaceae bacterium]
MLRSIRYILYFLWLILTTGLGLVFCLFRPFHPDNLRLIGRFFGYPALKIMGLKYELRGSEILDNNRPCVVIAPHQNNLDLILGGVAIPKRTVSLGKISLIRIPIFGWFYWLSGNILINRTNKRKAKASMNKVTDMIRNKNISIWIMPEGTRSRGRGLLPFKSGAFRTAIDAQVPIVPMCFNSYHVNTDTNKLKSGKILGQVLEPIPTTGLDTSDALRLSQEAWEKMKAQIELLDAEVTS